MSVVRLRTADLAWRDVDGEIIVLDAKSSVYLTMNNAAAVLWQALAGGATRANLVGRLTTHFGIQRDRAETDVDTFLAELMRRRLVAADETVA